MSSKTKITAWSYSRLANYESCPRQFKYRNIDKLPEPKAEAMMRGIKIHNEAAKFLSGETDEFPDSCITFEPQFYELRHLNPIVEQQWAFNAHWKPRGWFDKDVWVRLTADAAKIYEDNTADIVDHKTGKRYDDDYTDQLGTFAGGLCFKFPEVEHVTTRMWYLDSGDEVIMEFTRDEAMHVLAGIVERAKVMIKAEKHPPNPSWKCRFCHFRAENGGPCEYGG